MEEDTDPNDDVSFGYLVTEGDHKWVLRLSMLGPYALFLRLEASVTVVSGSTTPLSTPEETMLTILAQHGIHVMDMDELLWPVPLHLLNTDPRNVRVYQALFTDSAVLPWEACG